MQGRITLKEALVKLRAFCASRERCHDEVRSKLLKLHVYGDDLEEIISQLISEGFLNEERFARSYVSGKFRISKWGRQKIIYGLRGKHVADYSIEKGLLEIDEEEYVAMIDTLLQKHLKGDLSFDATQKAVAALQRKGYEQGLVLDRLRALRKQG